MIKFNCEIKHTTPKLYLILTLSPLIFFFFFHKNGTILDNTQNLIQGYKIATLKRLHVDVQRILILCLFNMLAKSYEIAYYIYRSS